MKKVHISFANEKFAKSLDLLEKTSTEIGKVDKFIGYTQEWLKTTEFWRKNSYILSQPRGAGFWLFKTHIILEAFKTLEDGDVVLYSDAALKVIDDLNPLFETAQKDGNKMIFKLPPVDVVAHIAKVWTKRDCFILMDADEPKFWEAPMTNGAVSLWVKNQNTIDFLNEWQRPMRDPRIVTDAPNICGKPNFIEFKDHRHDQSVLTILAVKHNLELYRDPTQFGISFKDQFTNSPYGQLFDHHRNVNIK